MHERLDRERAAVDLDHALLVHDRAGVAVRHADRRPVALLAGEPARMMAARLAARDVLEEGVDRARELEGLHRELGDAAAVGASPPRGRAGGSATPCRAGRCSCARRRVASAACTVVHAAPSVEVSTRNARGARAGLPVDDEAAVLALLLEVDLEPVRAGGRARSASSSPGRRRAQHAGAKPGRALEARTSGVARYVRSSRRRSAIHTRARTARARPRCTSSMAPSSASAAAAGRSPGELDLAAAARCIVCQSAGKREGVPVPPPDVAAARVGELELEAVRAAPRRGSRS